MRKLVVSALANKIYLATINKNGTMSDSNRVDMTDEAIRAVAEHMLANAKGKEGYEYSFGELGKLQWVNGK